MSTLHHPETEMVWNKNKKVVIVPSVGSLVRVRTLFFSFHSHLHISLLGACTAAPVGSFPFCVSWGEVLVIFSKFLWLWLRFKGSTTLSAKCLSASMETPMLFFLFLVGHLVMATLLYYTAASHVLSHQALRCQTKMSLDRFGSWQTNLGQIRSDRSVLRH